MSADARMKSLTLRALTAGERALAREVFGETLDAVRIRLLALPLWPRAFATGRTLLVFPQGQAATDFAAEPLPLQGLFVHELTHVWQAQHGTALLPAKLRAGDGPLAYAYDLFDGRDFADLNIEQQAMVVQHAFLASRGAALRIPALAYGAYLAGLAPRQSDKPRNV